MVKNSTFFYLWIIWNLKIWKSVRKISTYDQNLFWRYKHKTWILKLRVVGDKEGKGVAGRGNSDAKWWDDENIEKEHDTNTFGFLEVDEIKHVKMKDLIPKE